MRTAACLIFLMLTIGTTPAPAADDLPAMKFNDVREVAPGVFFRYSSIGPETSNVPFGGCNNVWVVFDEFVVVIDANFPKEAGDVIEAIRTTTDKPIRYVFDTHCHGDHAYGNAVFGKAGASVIAQTQCAQWLRVKGPKEFADAGRPPTGRKDVAGSSLKVPNVIFDDKLVLDDGKQRVEFLFFGHGHTPGDACAYLPQHKILCTGDACVNGPYNYMGHSDSASWIRALDGMKKLDVQFICPGHGPVAKKDLLDKQQRYFVELRKQVQAGIDAKKEFTDILSSIDMTWYKEWTTVPANSRKENVEHVHGELTGRIKPAELRVQNFGIREGPSPTRDTPGWKKPTRIVVPNLMPARLAELKAVAPGVEFVPVRTTEDALKAVTDADAVVGFCSDELLAKGSKLRWIQLGDFAGTPAKSTSNLVLTGVPRVAEPSSDMKERQWILWLENIRRFTEGEPLLCVVQ